MVFSKGTWLRYSCQNLLSSPNVTWARRCAGASSPDRNLELAPRERNWVELAADEQRIQQSTVEKDRASSAVRDCLANHRSEPARSAAKGCGCVRCVHYSIAARTSGEGHCV